MVQSIEYYCDFGFDSDLKLLFNNPLTPKLLRHNLHLSGI